MPGYAIFSDVHSNLEALHAALKAIDSENPENIFFLGDSIGYGPNPNECIEQIRNKADIVLAGNHDWGAVGLTDLTFFNPYAKTAIEWTKDILSKENSDYISSLPLTAGAKIYDLFLAHASPFEPEKWRYIYSELDAYAVFPQFQEKICAVGHSHVPFIVELLRSGQVKHHYDSAKIKKQSRYIINVGSVGQPRDGNPDAAYAQVSSDHIAIKRASYDIVVTQKKMRKAGLPSYLIERLSMGR